MIKIQKEDFNVEEEINIIKNRHSNVGAVTSFIGYVRDNNNNTSVLISSVIRDTLVCLLRKDCICYEVFV